MRKILCIAIVIFWSNVSAFEIPSATAKGLGEAVNLSQPDISGLINSGISFDMKKSGIELGIVRNYNLTELDEYYVCGFRKFNKIMVAAAFSQFGDPDLYTEQVYKVTTAVSFNQLTFSVHGSIRKYNFNDKYASLTASNFGISFGYRHRYFIAGIILDDLAKLKLTGNSDELEQKRMFVFEILSDTPYKTYLKYELFTRFDNRFSFGEEIDISDTFTVLAGYRTKPSTISGGFKIKFSKRSLTYSVEHHPELGLTHGISFTFVQ